MACCIPTGPLPRSSAQLRRNIRKKRPVDSEVSTRKILGPWNVGLVDDQNRGAIPPKQEGSVRFVCISDTHCKASQLLPLPEGDVVLHGT